jgi:hypothetical protein
MNLLRRKPKVDRARFPHDYTGPGNKWGLKPDIPCRIVGSRAGGRRICTQDGRIWTVGANQVQKHVVLA